MHGSHNGRWREFGLELVHELEATQSLHNSKCLQVARVANISCFRHFEQALTFNFVREKYLMSQQILKLSAALGSFIGHYEDRVFFVRGNGEGRGRELF